ncbi:MAG: DUF3570 domain-containing protein [Cyclobacteriaceae bacterium]
MKSHHRQILITALLLSITRLAYAQESTASNKKQGYQMKPNTTEIEANFLSSYYQQDGNNGAVTGGIGTEQLTDIANIFIVNVPLDSINSIGFYGGADYYSSASTDNIDTYSSSASSSDVRAFATLSFNRKNLKAGETYGIRAGFSVEYDYTSVSTGLSYTKEWNEGNSELNITGQAFFDNWLIIYPYELRGDVSLPTSSRRSFNGQVNFSQVINKRLQMGISAEFVKMSGLLSTPFHRVYFNDLTAPDIERLPENRLKIPVGVRLNYYPIDNLILRTYYRYYWDDFGIVGHTFEIETPIKLASALTAGPFYRYHNQSGAKYFASYETHLSSELFYSSDYDLSTFDSHKYGLTIRYSPLYGLLRSNKIISGQRTFLMKYIETRVGIYRRSTGLNAYFISLNLGLSLK